MSDIHGAMDVIWRDLALSDLPHMATFAPDEWHVALDAVLLQHIGRRYFHARVAVRGNEIVAVGQGIATGRTGWIGNLIVRPDERNRGLGSRLTTDLVDELHRQGCANVMLVATALGEPVYRKLGFRTTAEYVFMDVPPMLPVETTAITRLNPADADLVMRLDQVATGETRRDLLAPHLASGWGHAGADGRLNGFFLPSLGTGLVIAIDPAAGLTLLRFKHALFETSAVAPAENASAIRFLLAHGARETARAPRMVLGEDAAWRPECIFARASGYCG